MQLKVIFNIVILSFEYSTVKDALFGIWLAGYSSSMEKIDYFKYARFVGRRYHFFGGQTGLLSVESDARGSRQLNHLAYNS